MTITKDDGRNIVTPGDAIVYTIEVVNLGPDDVPFAIVEDNFSARLTNISWLCTANTAAGAFCDPQTGTGNILGEVGLPTGESAAYTVNATVASTAFGKVCNLASVKLTVFPDIDPSNNIAVDCDRIDFPPLAVDDTAMVPVGEMVTIDVLANDRDPENGPLTLTATPLSAPEHGVVIRSGNRFKYTHDGSETRSDRFVYEVCDKVELCATATVSITINHPPQAMDDQAKVNRGGMVTVAVLVNDTDLDASEEGELILTPTPVSAPQHGTVELVGSAFKYTHDGSESQSDTFVYQVCDNGSPPLCDNAEVSIRINLSPVATDDEVRLNQGQTVFVDVLSNDADPDSETLTLTPNPIPGPQNGSVVLEGNMFRYTHDGSLTGRDHFGYEVCDECDLCDTARVTIEVNLPPVAGDDSATVAQGGTVSELDSGGISLLENDTDPEGGVLRVTEIPVKGPSHGMITLNTDGSFQYVHDGTQTFGDSFDYKVCDEFDLCDQGKVSITVIPPVPPVDLALDIICEDDFTFAAFVVNRSETDATEVVLRADFPEGFELQEADPSQGICEERGEDGLTCSIGFLGGGATAKITIRVRSAGIQVFTSRISVEAEQPERETDNNFAAFIQVNTTEDLMQGACFPTGGPPADPMCSLRVAVFEARLLEPTTIRLPAGAYTLLSEEIAIDGDEVHITSTDAANTVIRQSEGEQAARVFHVLPEADAIITGVTIRGGRAPEKGGGIWNEGDLELVESTIVGNQAGLGGGISNETGRLKLTDSTVSGNQAQMGGGVHNQGGSLMVIQSTFNDNEAESGGGIFSLEGRVVLTNSTLSGNVALQGPGGGILSRGSSVQSTNVTINENEAFEGGGGLFFDRFGPDAEGAELMNTIVAGNRPQDCAGPVVSKGYNLDGDDTCGLDSTGDQPATDPLMGPLFDNDGPTLTHALRTSNGELSPAIDTGLCFCGQYQSGFDQRGFPRAVDGRGNGVAVCDIGAYEAPPFQPETAQRLIPAIDSFPVLEGVDRSVLANTMLGSPLVLDRPDALSVLEPALGSPRPDLWVLLRYDPMTRLYRELSPGDDFFNFFPGRGFWLVARIGALLQLSGTPVDASGKKDISGRRPVELTLQPGFNQISTPFNFRLNWVGCIVRPGDTENLGCPEAPDGPPKKIDGPTPSPCLWSWQGEGGYNISPYMEPTVGYWAFNDSDVPITLTISPRCAVGDVLPDELDPVGSGTGASRIPTPDTPSGPEGWRVKLSVSLGAFTDNDNYLGVDSEARTGRDRLDYPEPPPLHGFWLTFPRFDWGAPWPMFASDIRAIDRDAEQAWDFEIRADIRQQEVRLSWTLIGAEGELELIDLDSGRVIDMRRFGVHRYNSGNGGTRRFRVLAR